ncbi:unnamed protein product, partial [Ceratitis capitata]
LRQLLGPNPLFTSENNDNTPPNLTPQKEQAEGNKIQAKLLKKKIAEAAIATAKSLREMAASSSRQVAALEN